MSVREEFDRWAAAGRDRGMERRHWHTAKQALARIPIEAGDVVLDLGSGSGYAARAMRVRGAALALGIDRSPEMARNAREYAAAADDDEGVGDGRGDDAGDGAGDGDDAGDGAGDVCFAVGDFAALPVATGGIDHAFSMEAFYYARDPTAVLREVRRALRSGGTFYCAVDYYAENEYAHGWDEATGLDLTLWSRAEYRAAFRDAGFHVAGQDHLPDREVEIPPPAEFPHRSGESTVFETREEMVERYRELGTLLTVGVAP